MSKWKEIHETKQEPTMPTLEEFEDSMEEQLDDVQKSFRDRIQKEEKRLKDACDSNYYFTVYFSNSKQLYEFCEKFGIDKDAIYVDGRKLARAMQKALDAKDTEFPATQAFNKDYVSRAREK